MTIKVNADKAIYKSSSWDETTLRINGVVVKWGDPVFIDRGRENVLELEAPPGFAKELQLGLGSGNLTFKASPDFETPVREPFKWKLTPDDSSKSGLVELVLYSADQVAPRPVECLVMSDDLANELKVLVNGDEIPPGGRNFNGNREYRITASWTDPEMAHASLKLEVVPVSGVGADDFTSMPPLGQPTPTRAWGFKGGMKMGAFKLRLSTENGMAKMESPINRLLPYADFTLKFDAFGLPAPLPPEKVKVLVGYPFTVAVRLRNSVGTPLAEIPVACSQDGTPLITGHTNSSGYLQIGLFIYPQPKLLKYSAIATLPDHTTSETEVWVDVVVKEQETDAT